MCVFSEISASFSPNQAFADYVFTPYDNSESATSHTTDLSLAGSVGSALMGAGMGLNGNFIIGEWSCALSDESLSGEENPISSRRQFCEVQEQTYRDVGSGAAFWSKCFDGPRFHLIITY
jgi:glucan 1,3-beta-glucosidase